jgi:hypothetical protein
MRKFLIERRRALACAAAVLAVLLLPSVAGADPGMESLQQAVVHIWVRLPDGQHIVTGSGFVVSKDGYIVTNDHVIDNEQLIVVLLQGEDEPHTAADYDNFFRTGRVAKVISRSPGRDLAVIKVDQLSVTPLTISNAMLEKNMPVYAIGYPGAAEKVFKSPTADPTVTNGVIGRLYTAPLTDSDDAESIPLIQHNAPINHGNSGGPLLDDCGRVIGINTWGNFDHLDSGGALETSAGVYYASRSLNLIPFLQANNVPASVTSDVCKISLFQRIMQRGLMDGGVAVLLLAMLAGMALLFRRPRKIILETVNRTAEAVSRRVSGKPQNGGAAAMETRKHPSPAKGSFEKLRFTGRHEAAPYSFEVTRSLLQRSRNGAIVGRLHSGVDVLVENDEVSRRHARIYLDGDRVVIEDLGSLNGTQADGVRLPQEMPAPLKPGSVVRLGPLAFDVKFE